MPSSPANHDYKAAFASTLMFKDLKLAQETAMEVGAVTPMAAQAAQLFALHNRSGNGGARLFVDHRAVQPQAVMTCERRQS